MQRKFLLVLAVMLVASVSALAQGTDKVGYIYCANGQYVYLYDSLSSFNVLANLRCGTKVGVLGSENGYVIVRTADEKQGYVPAGAITSTPPANAAEVRAAVNGGAASGSPVDMSGSPVGSLEPAQFLTRADIFGGYSYLNYDTNGVGSRQNFINGWEASVAANAYKWLALEGGLSGHYKTYSYNLGPLGTLKVSVHDYDVMGGPRFNYGRMFLHGLIGVDHLSSSAQGSSSSASENSFAAAIGGGAQYRIARDWSVRGSADYLITRHTVGLSHATQNNIRVSGGIVYTVRTRND